MVPLVTSTASDTVLYADDMRSAAVRCIFHIVFFIYSLSSESAQISAAYRRTACVVDIKSLILLCVGPPMLAINLLRDAVWDAFCAECCSCAVQLSLQSNFKHRYLMYGCISCISTVLENYLLLDLLKWFSKNQEFFAQFDEKISIFRLRIILAAYTLPLWYMYFKAIKESGKSFLFFWKLYIKINFKRKCSLSSTRYFSKQHFMRFIYFTVCCGVKRRTLVLHTGVRRFESRGGRLSSSICWLQLTSIYKSWKTQWLGIHFNQNSSV